MLAPSSHDQRRGSRTGSNFYIGNQSKKGTDYSNALYKTELCRSFNEMGCCRYGLKCRFAHGGDDLRPVTRHKKYKTEPCKNYSRDGICPYGSRCRFVHDDDVTEIMARAAISSPSPSSPPSENLFDFGGRFGASDFSDLKHAQIPKENPSILSEHFSSLLDGDGRSPWMDKLEKEEENEKNLHLSTSFYRKAFIHEKEASLPSGWSNSAGHTKQNGWHDKVTSPTTPTSSIQETDLLLLGTSTATRVFGNTKILPSHFQHYEDSSWQALAHQHRRQSFSSLSSLPPAGSQATPPTNSIASTTVASTPLSTVSPVSRSNVYQSAPRKSVIGFAAPSSISVSTDMSSFTPSPKGRSTKHSVIMEALEPEGDTAPLDKDHPLPQLPAFFGSLTPPSSSPTKPDSTLTFEEETTSKKSVQVVSSLSLSLSMVRTTATSTSGISLSTTTSSPMISSSLAPPLSSHSPATIPNSSTVRSSPSKQPRTHSFDIAEGDEDIQIFSLPRRRTKSMSMSLTNTSSLFAGFETSCVSKPKSIPKIEPLSTVLREPAAASTPESPGVVPELTLPAKRLPFFATLAISPKLEAPNPEVPTLETQNP